MAIDDLEWLETWYRQQCNGIWEHERGMLLEPVQRNSGRGSDDVTGWRLQIDLRGTEAAGFAPRKLAVCAMHGAWLRCALNGQRFEGEGAEVEELIRVFRQWVEVPSPLLGAANAV